MAAALLEEVGKGSKEYHAKANQLRSLINQKNRVEYEDMVQVVVSWTELSLRRNPEVARDFRVLTEAAFRSTWGCKQ